MSITVAVVVLNAADALPLTLESVLGQDHDDVELLVVDGASWDDTAAVLELYRDDIDRLEVIEDGGIYHAMNRALDFAGRPFIHFLNAGDTFHDARALSKLWRRKSESADIVYGNHVFRQKGVERFMRSNDFGVLFRALREGAVDEDWHRRIPAHQATVARTALMRELRFDTAFRICADHDLLFRAAARGARLQYVDEIVAFYESGGFSEQRWELCRLEYNACYRRFSEVPAAVDLLFYGEGSVFRGWRSPLAGDFVAGLSDGAPGGAAAVDADGVPATPVQGSGCRVRSPEHRPAVGLTLAGRNEAPGNGVEIYGEQGLVGRATLPVGAFHLWIAFDAPVPPAAFIDVVPASSVRQPDGSVVSFWVSELRFELDDRDLPVAPADVPIVFNSDHPAPSRDLLGPGWYTLEPQHVWCRAEGGTLRLLTADPVAEVELALRHNPVIAGQTVTIHLNGEAVAETLFHAPEATTRFVPKSWTPGQINTLRLVPSAAATVGADRRALGVALVALTLYRARP